MSAPGSRAVLARVARVASAAWLLGGALGCTGRLDEPLSDGGGVEVDAALEPRDGGPAPDGAPDAFMFGRPDAAIDASLDAGPPDGIPPTASAGSDLTITWPIDRTVLDGTSAGAIASAWEQVSGPSASILREATVLTPVATMLRVGVYVFRLTATDNEGLSASDEVTVTVLADPHTPTTLSQHLDAQVQPIFRTGRTLPPLSFGGFPHLDFNRRAAERYNFALHIGAPVAYWAEQAAMFNDRQRDIITLSAGDPERYPISINMTGYDGWYDCARLERVRALHPEIAMHHMDGSLWTVGTAGCFELNPTAPAAAWQAWLDDTGIAGYLQTITDAAESHGAHIAVMNDLGEWGFGVPRIGDAHWDDPTWNMWQRSADYWQDASVRAAWGPLPSSAGYGRAIVERGYEGISLAKGVSQGTITEALVAATSPGVLYTHYQAGPPTHIGRFNEWGQEGWDHAILRAHHVNHPDDVYSEQVYYGDNNEGGLGVTWRDGEVDGGRASDHFTHALAAAAHAIAAGSPHAYVWIAGRGSNATRYADFDELTGFLKAYYCLAMIGGPLFSLDFRPADTDPATTGLTTIPGWMRTMMVMGEVHALFSHLEEFVYDGHALPNAHGDMHPFQRWIEPFPLYEQYAYPVGAAFSGPHDPSPTVDRTVRVVARVRESGDEWLVAGWVAAGADREMDVELPAPLGRTTLHFRRSGSVYRLTRSGGTTLATLVDVDGMRPTDHMLETD